MAQSESTPGKEFNTWVQTVGILIAAVWAAYTFIYKEILVPKSAPVNITVNLQLKKIGSDNAQGKEKSRSLVAVEMRTSATNPSSREVYLLPSAYIVYGHRIDAVGEKVTRQANLEVNASQYQVMWKHAAVTSSSVVAGGNLFPDSSLKPNETVTRTLVFYVPAGVYDTLEVFALAPTTAKKRAVELEWKLDEKQVLMPVMYRVAKNGERIRMSADAEGGYADASLELQTAESMSMLSLWQ